MSEDERRRETRTISEFAATLVAGNFLYPCVVADHSAKGARLVFDQPVYLRGPMELMVDDLITAPCRAVWRNDREMGVRFG